MDLLNGIIKGFSHHLLWIEVKLLSSEAPDFPTGNNASINIEDILHHFISLVLHWSDNTTELLLLKCKFDPAFLSEVTPVLPSKLAYVRDISLSAMCGSCWSVPIQLKQSMGINIMNLLPTLCAIIPNYHGTVSNLDVFYNCKISDRLSHWVFFSKIRRVVPTWWENFLTFLEVCSPEGSRIIDRGNPNSLQNMWSASGKSPLLLIGYIATNPLLLTNIWAKLL